MRKYFTLFVTLLSLSSVIIGQTLSVGKVTCSSTPLTLVHVPVTISAPLTDVKSISFQFSFDNTSIASTFDAEKPKSGISNFALNDSVNYAISENNGLISFSWFNSTGVTLNGKIFDLDFLYRTNFSEVKIVTATIKNMQGKKLTVALSNGSVSTDTSHAIRLIYPNGGENLEITGSPTKITWTSVYISHVGLEYTIDNGSTWNTIAANLAAATDSYSWTIPDTINSTKCKIRITDADSTTITSDVSDDVFTINSVPIIKLLTPLGGEELRYDAEKSVKSIKWYSRNILNVKIEYTTNSTATIPTWQSIINSTAASDSMYEWIIPSTLSTNCKVRISDVDHSSVLDTSDFAFTIMNSSIKVKVDTVVEAHLRKIGKITGLYKWWSDSTHFWQSKWPYVDVDGKLIYARDTLEVTGTVPVKVGWLTSVQYLQIKLKYDSNILDVHSIIPAYSELKRLSYSTENGVLSIVWATGTPMDLHGKILDIVFKYKNFINPLQWMTLDDIVHSENPVLPHLILDRRNFSDIVIKSVVARNSINEYIDATNWINGHLAISDVPAVKLLSPVGGEVFEVNDVNGKIYWDSRKVTNVSLQYSIDKGSNWTTIATGLSANSDSCSWALPDTNSTKCLVRIYDSSSSSVCDTSAKVFSITNVKSINLTSPNGGEILKVGTIKDITWSSTNISNVKLEYTVDDSVTWNQISASASAKNHKYSWTVPSVSSTACRVRISAITDSTLFDKSANLFTINNSKVKVFIDNLVSPAGSISVPVKTEPIYSITYMNLAVQYDATAMELDTVICSSTLSNNDGFFHHVDDNGIIRIVWYNSTPADMNGILFTIKFKNWTGNYTQFKFSTPNKIKNSNDEYLDFELVNGSIGTVDVEEDVQIPFKYALQQNYPNPFNPTTTIQFEIPKQTHVTLNIYNSLGQKVATLVEEDILPGYHKAVWNSSRCASGVYFYSIITKDFVQTKKMILLK